MTDTRLPTPHVRVEPKTSRDVTRYDVWLVLSPTYVETAASCPTAEEADRVARNIADERSIPFITTVVECVDIFCPLCGGDPVPLGRLGRRDAYRCQDCGWTYTLTATYTGEKEATS